jgi:hypothetical protein
LYATAGSVGHTEFVQDKLAALETQLEAIALRIGTLGLTRAADDLRKVSAELGRLRASSTDLPGSELGPGERSIGALENNS